MVDLFAFGVCSCCVVLIFDWIFGFGLYGFWFVLLVVYCGFAGFGGGGIVGVVVLSWEVFICGVLI